MPLQNRVDPFGELNQVSDRGTLMGNRGILHDEFGSIRRKHAHQNWVTCSLNYKGVKQQLMKPGRYTQLFFLDEVTSLAAGHRPCATCQRERYKSFVETWCQVHGHPGAGKSVPQAIDKTLHASRIARGKKVTFEKRLSELPDGTMFEVRGQCYLLWKQAVYSWSFGGYQETGSLVNEEVSVLTPKPVYDMYSVGWVPSVGL